MKKPPDNEDVYSSSLELLAKFKNSLLSSKHLEEFCKSSPQGDELIAKAAAIFCLENNIKADKFNTLFQYQLVDILKQANAEISNVQIAARTGIDRRSVSSIKNSSIKKATKQSKDMLVLSYLKSYCKTYKTTYIKKKGCYNSFEYFCSIAANGALTAHAVAKELLRMGYLKDKGLNYQIVFDDK